MMPIRPESRSRYPADWPAISRAIRERAGHRCEWCGVENYALGGRAADGAFMPAVPQERLLGLSWPKPGEVAPCQGRFGYYERARIIRIVLTVAHLDHRPENCDPANLRALCQRCHNRHDAAERRRGRAERTRLAAAVADLFVAEEVRSCR